MSARPARAAPRRPLAALALLTGALLGYEVLLPRVIAIQHWHHLTEVVIAVALLGLASAAVLAAALAGTLERHLARLLPASALATALGMPLGLLLAQQVPLNMLALPWYWQQSGYLLLYALCFVLPFFSGGLFITLTFMRWSRVIGACYAADLLGSAAGVVLVLLWLNSPLATLESALLLCAALALLAWLACATVTPRRLLLAGAGGLALVLLAPAVAVTPSNFKSLAVQLNERGARQLWQWDSVQSRLTGVRTPAQHLAPGLSLASGLEAPRQRQVFTDGEGALPLLLEAERDGHRALFAQSLSHAAWLVAPLHPRVLILPGNHSWNSWNAFWHGARSITLVEPDRQLARLLRDGRGGADFIPPGTELRVTQPRRALAAGGGQYDLIVTEVDSYPGGAPATRIEPLLTRQSLSRMLDRLGPRGTLAFGGQLMPLPRDSLRLLHSLAEVLRERGRVPAHHLLVLRDWHNYLILVNPAGFHRQQLDAVQRWAGRWQFDPVSLPGQAVDPAQLFHRGTGEQLLGSVSRLLAEDSAASAAFVADYPFNLAVTDDSRPFFYHFFRWSRWQAVRDSLGPPWLLYVGWGYLLSLAALGVLALASGALLLAPLAAGPLRRAVHGKRLGIALYFGAIGLGFMLFEIALIQQSVLLANADTEAFALVLVAVLAGAGAGSFLAGNRVLPRRTAWLAVGSIFAACLCYPGLLEGLFTLSLDWPHPLRLGALALLLLLPALPMGTLLPQGLAAIRDRGGAAVAWAWGINGFCSVLGALAAPLIAVELGWSGPALCAAGLYLLAGWSRGALTCDLRNAD